MIIQIVEFGNKKITMKTEKDSDTTYISKCGNVVGKPADDIKAGDWLVWNGGAMSLVIAITKETKCYVTLLEEYDGVMNSGKQQIESKYRKDRIIAIAY